MEIFKTGILKKEFEWFQKEDLIQILKCDYCQKTARESFHTKILVSCKFCRQKHCKNCQSFNIAKENLLSNVDEIGKEYIENFIKDYLNLSYWTIENNYKVIIKRIPVENIFQVKSYIKSIKNRTQVINQTFVDFEKCEYAVKGKNRTFYKKFWLFTLDHKNELA